MKLLKVKGIVIKEVPFKDNDKIITLMTDSLGKISCMAKGARKTNSALLASCQFLVYSEFVLYKGTSFYHINSAETIDTFYSLRTDYDKLQKSYEITKVLNSLTMEEEENSSKVLSLYLNSLFAISKDMFKFDYIMSVFKLKILALSGFSPSIVSCSNCSKRMLRDDNLKYYYSFNTNSVLCGDCYIELNSIKPEKIKNGWYVSLSQAAFYALTYILTCDVKKVFAFKIDDKVLDEILKIADRLYIEQINF